MISPWTRPIHSILADVRYAFRGLRNAPGYAATVILTLALGLGATTAMLAIADSVLLRPLSYPHADRIESIRFLDADGKEQWNGSWKNFQALREGVRSLEAIAAYSSLPSSVTTADDSKVEIVVRATPSLFDVAGVRPLLGRPLTPADANTPVAVVGDAFWRESLHADPHALGRSIGIDGKLLTIVDVMPASFSFPVSTGSVAVYAPLIVDGKGVDSQGFSSFMFVARTRVGVSRDSSLAEAQAVQRHVLPEPHQKPMQLLLRPYLDSVVGDQQPALLALLAACALLLAISCVNAANLQIARSTIRAGEMLMRNWHCCWPPASDSSRCCSQPQASTACSPTPLPKGRARSASAWPLAPPAARRSAWSCARQPSCALQASFSASPQSGRYPLHPFLPLRRTRARSH